MDFRFLSCYFECFLGCVKYALHHRFLVLFLSLCNNNTIDGFRVSHEKRESRWILFDVNLNINRCLDLKRDSSEGCYIFSPVSFKVNVLSYVQLSSSAICFNSSSGMDFLRSFLYRFCFEMPKRLASSIYCMFLFSRMILILSALVKISFLSRYLLLASDGLRCIRHYHHTHWP